ncbi:MAG: DUF1552 domain-containing protein [Myxococcales bacterium]|nr:DUF1552 domain-containing protein [Myxococcales bacterium]
MSRINRMRRRQFLKGLAVSGASVSIGLPLLRFALNDHGEALADGSPIPTRFGVWFWGTGMRPSRWVPETAGAGDAWTLSSELAPLEGLKDYLSVVTNTWVTVDFDSMVDNRHAVGAAGVLTGDNLFPLKPGTMEHTVRQRSIDQLAADKLSSNVARRSMEIAVYPEAPSAFGGTLWDHISHNGPSAPNPAEPDLRAFFYRMFTNAQESYVNDARQSVLDVVQDQANELQNVLGAEDRIRLDQHLEGIRTVEKALASTSYCSLPPAPNNLQIVNGNREAIVERNAVASQLVALALSCRVSNVFNVMFSKPASNMVLNTLDNGSNSIHAMAHSAESARYDLMVHQSVIFVMEQLAVFLNTLKNTPDGSGNLLDNSVVYSSSDLSDGHNHKIEEMPMLISGKGGGRLRGNVHHRFAERTNASGVGLTALRAAGVDADAFGTGGGLATTSISSLET